MSYGSCIMDDAFCGCSLRTVSLVCLYTYAIVLAAYLWTGTAEVSSFPKYQQVQNDRPPNLSPLKDPDEAVGFKNSFKQIMMAHGKSEIESELQASQWQETLGSASSFAKIFFSSQLVCTVLCIYGIHSEKPQWMFPYVLFGGMLCTLSGLLLLLLIGCSFFFTPLLFFTIQIAFVYGFFYYLYLVVCNCYREMKEVKCNPRLLIAYQL